MTSIRDRLVNLALGPERAQLRGMMHTLTEAYLAGPFEMQSSPDQLRATLKEYDSALVQDLVNEIEWERIGIIGYDALFATEARRVRAVKESRRLWIYDVVTAFIIQLWTDFGFGENVTVTPKDPQAVEVWDRFWKADANDGVLAADNLQGLSETVLSDGDLFLAYFVSTIDGAVTVRTVDALEITEIVTDPDDGSRPLLYKRQYSAPGGQAKTVYYPDWQEWLGFEGPDKAGRKDPFATVADKVKDGERADQMKAGTVVVMQHCAYKRKGGLRGWPLMTAGAPWSREHRKFRENRAAVAAAMAMYVQKIKAKGGSRAIDAIRAKLGSSLAAAGSTTGYETNPPAPAGSTFLENEAATMERLPMSTAASDAQVDGGSLLMMAGLGGGVYPHWLGAGEAFRLATACYAEGTEILTRTGWKDHLAWDGKEEVACYNPETREQEFHVPREMLVYDYQGPMIGISGRGIDALVTPNHRMLVLNENNQGKRWAKKDWEIQRADELSRRFALPTSALDTCGQQQPSFTIPGYETLPAGMGLTRHKPDVVIDMDDWLRFLGWWIAEGWLEKPAHKYAYTVGIAISANAPEVAMLRDLLSRLPFAFSEDKNRALARWRATSKPLHAWLSENCGSGCANKKVPRFVFDLSIDQRRLFLDALWAGDGHTTHQEHYRGFLTTTSKQLADDVQQLVLGLGEWGHLALSYEAGSKTSASVRTNRDCYVVHRNQIAKRSYERGRNISEIQYKGKVACFRVKTGFYITRRNGRPLIAGNTAMEAPMHRQFSRYKLFWGEQFRRMLKIVLGFDTLYGQGHVKHEDTDAEVSTDRLIEVDLKMISDAVSGLVSTSLQPYFEAGLIDTPTTGAILQSIWIIALQALGVEDPKTVAPPAGFSIPETAQESDLAEGEHRRPFVSGQRFLREARRELTMGEAGSHQADYASGLRAAARAFWSGTWTRSEALDGFGRVIETGLRFAWIEGTEAAGINRDEMTDEDLAGVDPLIEAELQALPGLLDFIGENSKANGGKLGAILTRVEMWSNRYLAVVNAAMLAARSDPKMEWEYGATLEHCRDCSAYVGKVYRASVWLRWGAQPQSQDLACHGYNCGCKLTVTSKKLTPGHPRSPTGGD